MGKLFSKHIKTGAEPQIHLGQYDYINKIIEIEKEIIEQGEYGIVEPLSDDEPDFYVGENKKVLPKKYKRWIGDNLRNDLLRLVKNTSLTNAIKQLYREKSFIGDGGTAAIIQFEKATKLNTGRNNTSHLQKGKDMLKYLSRISNTNNLNYKEEQVLSLLVNDLTKAIGGK